MLGWANTTMIIRKQMHDCMILRVVLLGEKEQGEGHAQNKTPITTWAAIEHEIQTWKKDKTRSSVCKLAPAPAPTPGHSLTTQHYKPYPLPEVY